MHIKKREMKKICIERMRITAGSATFLIKVKSHRGKPITVRRGEIETGISEACKRVSIFSFATQGGK